MTTITPPHRKICMHGGSTGRGVVTASSNHQGGARILMGDGAVIFITDSIEYSFDCVSRNALASGSLLANPHPPIAQRAPVNLKVPGESQGSG
jgi:hypothetical protein